MNAEPEEMPGLLTPFLDRVLSYLSRSELVHVALTCRTWAAAALPLVWSSFKFVRERDFERVFAIITRHNTTHPYGTYIKRLDLTHAEREFLVSPNIIFLVTSHCPNIESITITFLHTRPVAPPQPIHNQHQNINNATNANNPRPALPPMRRPGAAHPLPGPNRPPPMVRHSPSLPLAHFAHNCQRLRFIRLIAYSPRSDDSVYEMAKYLRSSSLQTVIFSGCATLQSSTLCKLAITNPQLRQIEITGNTPVNDASVSTIADRCGANLELLSIGNARNLTDMSLRYIARRCRKIRQICMVDNPDELSETALSDIVRRCSTLQVFSLSNARALGVDFFETLTLRVNRELETIRQTGADPVSGLQCVCLGGIRRDVIDSPAVHDLIELSATAMDQHNNARFDDDQDKDDEDDDDDNGDIFPEHNLAHMMGNLAFMPNTRVVRGNTIWWRRRRP
ncbi:hypothetical protein EC973_007703 [Apophysomyces ossiformis]|uniref:F-box domain-containing protein n=1 Tax=Apophysomyces ossiformis TaxID=679940 RepID=A0A8H7BVB9_9FUNG|nr:hypothetical protein EC973_007703 [Apophysomyces ossiformis]